MLEISWIMFCGILLAAAAQRLPTILKANETNKADLTLKHAGPTVKQFTLKARNMNKLTFQTLYPNFMSNWTKLSGEKPISNVVIKDSTTNITPERNLKKLNGSMIRKSNAMYNAFIDVVTMTPYVPKRIMSYKTISKNYLTESENQIFVTNYLKYNTRILHLLPQAKTKKILIHSNTTALTTRNHSNSMVKQIKTLSTNTIRSPSLSTLSRQKEFPAEKNNNISLQTDESIINTLKPSERNLKNVTIAAKNDTDAKTKVQKKKLPGRKVNNSRNLSSVRRSIKTTMSRAKSKRRGDKRNQDFYHMKNYKTTTTKNLKERIGKKLFYRRKNTKRRTIKNSKSRQLNLKKQFAFNNVLKQFRTAPFRRNNPHLNLKKNKSGKKAMNDQVFSEILNKIRTAPVRKQVYTTDSTEAKGNEMLKKLDLPGLQSISEVTIPNNEWHSFDHLKYVDNVMRRSLPLNDKKNIIMKAIGKRMSELYRRNNVRPKEFQDDLDDVMKAVGATLFK